MMIAIQTALVTLVVAPVVFLIWRWARIFIALQRLPHPKGNLLLGNMMDLLRPNHHRYMRQWAKDLGGIFSIRVLTQQAVVLVDARLINLLYGSSENLDKYLENMSDALLSQKRGHHTMFSSETNSSYWRLIRKGTAPAFITKNIRNGFPGIMAVCQRMAECLHEAGPTMDVDMNNMFMRYAMDVTGLVGFAKDFKVTCTLSDSKTDSLFENLRTASMELYSRASNPFREYSLWSKEVRNGLKAIKEYKLAMRALLNEVKARGPPSASDVSIAAHLMRLKDPRTGQPLEDDLLVGEFGVFFSAGIESAGNALSWTTYLISQHPEVEAHLVAELDAAELLVTRERPNPRPLQFSDLGKLTYLGWVCKEAMRMMPVASMGTSRLTKRDMIVDGHFIPARTVLLAPFDAVHHHPMNWDDPDTFLPERWAAPAAEFLPGEGVWASLSCGSRSLESPLAKASSLASQLSKAPSLSSPLAKTSSLSSSLSHSSPLASPLARTSSMASPELRKNSLRTSSSGLTTAKSAEGKAELQRQPSYMTSTEATEVEGAKRFLPFSTGPRGCLGQSLGRMMHDAAIAHLFAHFHMVLAERMGGPEGVEAQETNRLTLQPGNGLYFNCIPRGVKSGAALAPNTPDRAESPPPRVVY